MQVGQALDGRAIRAIVRLPSLSQAVCKGCEQDLTTLCPMSICASDLMAAYTELRYGA